MAEGGHLQNESPPWQVGVCDAHCHPTDMMDSIPEVQSMKAKALTIMASRSQDQVLVAKVAREYPVNSQSEFANRTECAVVPAFGWHPWFSHQLIDDQDSLGSDYTSPHEHYKNVLTPMPEDDEFLDALPTPRLLSEFLKETESRLRQLPVALVGEIGLDKAFRLPVADFQSLPPESSNEAIQQGSSYTPGSREGRALSPYRVNMSHQKAIFKAQLQLAGRLRRPVSVHSVQTHGVVFEVFQDLWAVHEKPSKRQEKRRRSVSTAHFSERGLCNENAPSDPEPPLFPPRICLHSYSGPPDHIKQILRPTVPADIFFSFSEVINFSTPSAKVLSVIKLLPESQILIESDFHCAGKEMDDLLGDILKRVCEVRGWSLAAGAERLRKNWERFVFG
jgi:Tat protein secretion system quality control protein TatD with DNase activity